MLTSAVFRIALILPTAPVPLTPIPPTLHLHRQSIADHRSQRTGTQKTTTAAHRHSRTRNMQTMFAATLFTETHTGTSKRGERTRKPDRIPTYLTLDVLTRTRIDPTPFTTSTNVDTHLSHTTDTA